MPELFSVSRKGMGIYMIKLFNRLKHIASEEEVADDVEVENSEVEIEDAEDNVSVSEPDDASPEIQTAELEGMGKVQETAEELESAIDVDKFDSE